MLREEKVTRTPTVLVELGSTVIITLVDCVSICERREQARVIRGKIDTHR